MLHEVCNSSGRSRIWKRGVPIIMVVKELEKNYNNRTTCDYIKDKFSYIMADVCIR